MPDTHHSAETDRRLLQLSEADNVCVAAATLEPGERVSFLGTAITVASRIPIGHKIAIRPIATGEHVMKYGLSIGSATRPIASGEHVHTHNLTSDYHLGSAGEGSAHSGGTT